MSDIIYDKWNSLKDLSLEENIPSVVIGDTLKAAIFAFLNDSYLCLSEKYYSPHDYLYSVKNDEFWRTSNVEEVRNYILMVLSLRGRVSVYKEINIAGDGLVFMRLQNGDVKYVAAPSLYKDSTHITPVNSNKVGQCIIVDYGHYEDKAKKRKNLKREWDFEGEFFKIIVEAPLFMVFKRINVSELSKEENLRIYSKFFFEDYMNEYYNPREEILVSEIIREAPLENWSNTSYEIKDLADCDVNYENLNPFNYNLRFKDKL